MAEISQKNKQQELSLANVKLPGETLLDSKEDLFSKANINKQTSLSDLKFPGASNDAKYTQAVSVEKTLNDFSGTAMKIGLKGLVALSKAQQQMEDRSSQHAMRMENNRTKPNQKADRLANLLALFSLIKFPAIAKKLIKLLSKRIKQNTEERLDIEEVAIEPEPGLDHLEDKPQR